MIVIPPSLPEPSATPRRPEGAGSQTIPAVLADKAGVNPGVVLNLPSPVLETPTDGMQPRDAVSQPSATQIDNEVAPASLLRVGQNPSAEVEVRQGLNTAGLPERLVKLLSQLQQLANTRDVPVMWPGNEQLRAARPEVALANLRRALGDSMLFEAKRLQTRLLPSSVQVAPSAQPTSPPAASGPMLAARVLTEQQAQVQTPAVAIREGGVDSSQAAALPPTEASGGSEAELPALSETYSKPRPAVLQQNAGDAASAVPAQPSPQAPPAARPVKLRDAEARDAQEIAEPTAEADVGSAGETLPKAAPLRTESLSTDSQSIREAVRLLLHGELRWQGELSPGVYARLTREDVWEEASHAPGALVKGTMVSVDMDLPTLGSVRVRGMFIKDAVRVTILPEAGARVRLQGEFADLRARLDARGLEGAAVRLADNE